jgi:hypothetical protein
MVMSPICLVIAEGQALPCETMKIVLDGDPDVHAVAPGTEVSQRSGDVLGAEA